jgi:hypothetical protein
MTCSWSLNFEQFTLGSGQMCPQSTGPERPKMLVSDPAPRRIPKIVGTNTTLELERNSRAASSRG